MSRNVDVGKHSTCTLGEFPSSVAMSSSLCGSEPLNKHLFAYFQLVFENSLKRAVAKIQTLLIKSLFARCFFGENGSILASELS